MEGRKCIAKAFHRELAGLCERMVERQVGEIAKLA
jgi:hypothetical protein